MCVYLHGFLICTDRDQEASCTQLSSVSEQGVLLEYETLELRIHPPNVDIDNRVYDDR